MREKEAYRDQLASIIAFHPEGEKLTVQDVANYTGASRAWVQKTYPFIGVGKGQYITRTMLAREMIK